MIHLDFYADNLDQAVKFTVECGAKVAEKQYFRTSRTMIDLAGHPFCLDIDESE